MNDPDLRPQGPSSRQPPPISAPSSRWWEPLTTKWGLIGIVIFIGLVMGLWDSAKQALSPSSAVGPAPSNEEQAMRRLAEKCSKIADFAERAACEKPIEAWRLEQLQKSQTKYRAERAEEEAQRKRERDYEAYRQKDRVKEGIRSELISLFREALPKGAVSYLAVQTAIDNFYRLQRLPQINRPANDAQRAIRSELENVDVMPFEIGANLVVKYVGDADIGTIRKAARDIDVTRALGRPELIGAPEAQPRTPLFPVVPTLSPPRKIEMIDNRPPTPEEERKWQRTEQKWQLQRAVLGIYKDCEEHFRTLYVGHLKSLLQTYAGFASSVNAPPQEKTYPLFLFDDRATANEWLGGALVVLWQEELTPLAAQRIRETPERIMGKSCPADRREFEIISSSTIPEMADVPMFGKKPEELNRDDPLFMATLKTAYERCRPSIRFYYALHLRAVAARVVVLKERRAAVAADTQILAALQSADRALAYKTLQDVFASPAISPVIASALPEAAASLFYDRCPATPPSEQLAEHRKEMTALDARIREYQKQDDERAKKGI